MIAICVGHSRVIDGRRDGGAVSVSGVSEWDYNNHVASLLHSELRKLGHDSTVINSYGGDSYTAAMTWLGKQVKELDANAAIELHFNSFSKPTANGNEWLHWPNSKGGMSLAKSLESAFGESHPWSTRRGVKPADSRGTEFLRRTHCPAVICEPFFGSNPKEWVEMSTEHESYAKSLAKGIDQYLKCK